MRKNAFPIKDFQDKFQQMRAAEVHGNHVKQFSLSGLFAP